MIGYSSMQVLQKQGELVGGDQLFHPNQVCYHTKNTMSMASVPKKPIFPKSLL